MEVTKRTSKVGLYDMGGGHLR